MLAELKTFFIAASPLIELRGALPVALEVYNMPVWSALFFSFLGNIFSVFLILAFLKFISNYLMEKSRVLKMFLEAIIKRTKKRQAKKFEIWEDFALIILVAIPLPFTGGWTGALCAFIFDIPFKKSILLIALGLLIAELIVFLITTGIVGVI